MAAGDLATLERLIGRDALYVHTNGLRETGAEYLELIANGTYRYADVVQPEMTIRFLGDDIAIVTGRTILRAILPDGSIKVVDGRSIVVWWCEAGNWRLQHYQGTCF